MSSAPGSDVIKISSRVEARHGGGPSWFEGKVTAVDGDNLHFDILYDDGDREGGVPRHRIRLVGQKQPRVLQQGERMDAFFGGGDVLFAGSIMGVNANGTYVVQYDDGDIENAVERNMIIAEHRWPPAAGASSRKMSDELDSSTEQRLPNTRKSALAGELPASAAPASAPTASTPPFDASVYKVAAGALSARATADLQSVFNFFDVDGDGTWSLSEFNAFQREIGQDGFGSEVSVRCAARLGQTAPGPLPDIY